MTRKKELASARSTCATFTEYVKDHMVDLGRIRATTRTLLASWALLAVLGAAMLLAPALAHGARYAELHARQAVAKAVAHRSPLGHGLQLFPAAKAPGAG
jgi:hypothetical protein